jgi:hypothetical protein
MDNQIKHPFKEVYLLNPKLNSQQLYDAINACLCKAEALAATAATTDFEAYESDTINSYMWALRDIIHEAKWLYNKIDLYQK